MESRVLILNHDPVFEDRLLSFFDTEEGVEIRVVRSVSEAVLVLMAENFDGFIVEGPPATAIEAATMGRQHFPSLKILCVPWQRPRGELLEDADRQQVTIADGTRSTKRLRREIVQFVRVGIVAEDSGPVISVEGRADRVRVVDEVEHEHVGLFRVRG